LIRSEIDCARPVIYKAEKKLFSPEKHYFVIDGYTGLFFPHFHINFGWPNTSYNNSWHYLWNIYSQNYDYRQRHEAIIGISPTYTDDVSYTVLGNRYAIEA